MPFILILVVFFGYSYFKLFYIFNENWPMALATLAFIFSNTLFCFMAPRKATQQYDKPWFRATNLTAMFIFGVWSSYLFSSIFIDAIFFTYSLITDTCCSFYTFTTLSRTSLLVMSLFSGMGYFIATSGLKIERVSIQDPRIKKALHIAQVSDLHIGPTIQSKFVTKIGEKLSEIKPDFIALTGDIVDGSPHGVAHVIEQMGAWNKIAPVYYVTGNHEYYWGAEQIVKQLQNVGIRVLTNEKIDLWDHNVHVVGLPDHTGRTLGRAHTPNWSEATKGLGVDTFNILLIHQPNNFKPAFENNVSLMLCGHTHGGQYFPFSLMIGLFHKYSKGLHLHKNRMWIYVHRGTGYWGPRNRFGARPEIASIEISPS